MSDEPQSEPTGKRVCPRCGSADVRLSSRSGALALFLGIFLLHPYRCRSCHKRFFRTAGKENTTYMEESHREASPGPEMSEAQAAEKCARVLRTDHWLKSYMADLLGAHQIGNGLDFQTAELLLKQEKESFEADLVL